jgi:ribosomal-protein-alanine N-acetyltransferase
VLDGIGFGGFESPAILVMSTREPDFTRAFFAPYPNVSSIRFDVSSNTGVDLVLIDSSLSMQERQWDVTIARAFNALKPSGQILIIRAGDDLSTVRQLSCSLDNAGFISRQIFLDVGKKSDELNKPEESGASDLSAVFTLTLAVKMGERSLCLKAKFHPEAIGTVGKSGSLSHEARVRPMTETDLNQVMNIEFTVFQRPWSPLAFALELRSNQHALYLVLERSTKEGSEIIGYVGLWCVRHEAWITRIAVASDQTRNGWGSCLLRQAEEFARVQGIGTVFLEIRQSNTRASLFYTVNGYRQAEVFRDYYDAPNEDALVLKKELPAILSASEAATDQR